MKGAWFNELFIALALVLGLGFLFALLGLGTTGILAGFLVYLAHHLRQLYRMERWLRVGRLRNPPESWGVWGHVYQHYYRWQKRYYSRKKKLGKVIREFRDSTAAMPDGTLVLDSHFAILWFNDAAEKMLRLSSQRDLGQSILNLVRRPVFRDYVQSKSYDVPIQFPSPQDDDVLLSARLIPYGREQYLLLLRDISRIQRLQTMRRDFVANASHELRSPLTVISGYLQALPDSGALPPEWHEPIEEMQAQCTRMSGLVEDLLELSRLETEITDASSELRVDVPDLIARVIQTAQNEDSDQHPIEFKQSIDHGLWGVERELHSAFFNLLSNALRYSEQGRPVVVSWFINPQGEGVFSVEDQGIGISQKHLPFVTQRFYRVDTARNHVRSGTGLGLAIVKHVLQRHGARLEIESSVGEGSAFRCIFPPGRLCTPINRPVPQGDGHETEMPLTLNKEAVTK